jgi:hypothetical protein
MTESEGTGLVSFNQQQAAKDAVELFKELGYGCQLQLNTINQTIKCSWALVPHMSKACVRFQTKQTTQQV